jgi:hypothetical protein
VELPLDLNPDCISTSQSLSVLSPNCLNAMLTNCYSDLCLSFANSHA